MNKDPRNGGRRYSRRSRYRGSVQSRRRGSSDGHGLLCLRGIRGAPASPEAILRGKARHTSLTRGFTGRLARGIHNELLESLNRPGTEILPYPLQRALMRNLALPAQKAGNAELLALWAGQSANLARCPSVDELLVSLVDGAAEKISR